LNTQVIYVQEIISGYMYTKEDTKQILSNTSKSCLAHPDLILAHTKLYVYKILVKFLQNGNSISIYGRCDEE